MAQVSLTLIPTLNSVVIRQEGIHYFIAAPDSFIIDRAGYLRLFFELMKIGFITFEDLEDVARELYYRKDEENATNETDSSDSNIG